MSDRERRLTTLINRLSQRTTETLFVFWVIGFFVLQMAGIPVDLLGLLLPAALPFLAFLARPYFYIEDLLIMAYSGAVAVILALVSLVAIDPASSAVRAVATLMYFAGFYLVASVAASTFLSNPRVFKRNTTSMLLAFLLLALLGGFTNDAFRGGGGSYRLTLGVNANTLAFIGLVIVYWVHMSCAVARRWHLTDVLALIAAFAVIAWSGSISVYASLMVFYIVLVFLYILSGLVSGRVSKLHWLVLVFFATAGAGIFALWSNLENFGQYHPLLSYIETRLAFGSHDEDSNFTSRQAAWSYLLEYYYASPILGSVGWYNGTSLLSHLGDEVASLPHNLYVRIVSEVGLIGLVSILSFPVFVVAFCTVKYLQAAASRSKNCLPFAIVAAGTVALFLREYGENSYLTNYMTLSTSVVLFLAAVAFNHRYYKSV